MYFARLNAFVHKYDCYSNSTVSSTTKIYVYIYIYDVYTVSYLNGLPLEGLYLLTEILICLQQEKVKSAALETSNMTLFKTAT